MVCFPTTPALTNFTVLYLTLLNITQFRFSCSKVIYYVWFSSPYLIKYKLAEGRGYVWYLFKYLLVSQWVFFCWLIPQNLQALVTSIYRTFSIYLVIWQVVGYLLGRKKSIFYLSTLHSVKSIAFLHSSNYPWKKEESEREGEKNS